MTDEPREVVERVSTLELFFDLVFVFTITQLTALLVHEPDAARAVPGVRDAGVIWWMYAGYAWLTNAVAPDRASRRFCSSAGMGGVPGARARDSGRLQGRRRWRSGWPTCVVVTVHAGLFTRSSSASVIRAIVALAPFNLTAALLVLAGGIAGGTASTCSGRSRPRSSGSRR